MGCFACFDGGKKQQQRKEEEQKASLEARSKAAEAAEKRQSLSLSLSNIFIYIYVFLYSHRIFVFLLWQQQFDQSAAGKAARAQIAAAAKQSANPNSGEPVLKSRLVVMLLSVGTRQCIIVLLIDSNNFAHSVDAVANGMNDSSIIICNLLFVTRGVN
ncbi:hypothetical protein RHMOL_Rhmol07G0283400 [Rhododendron molle]|uniref:Uncharacterized protein n=1 Tax=Rhododendron molle TaxID=49168 RepID=A0ACC0N5X3_RHOML|nr:hypothetical protein RHMOL_Rhmol07G0283400 [Rhododendron molle]